MSLHKYVYPLTPYAPVSVQLECHSQTQRGALQFGVLCVSKAISVPTSLCCGFLGISHPLCLGRLNPQVHASRSLCSAQTVDKGIAVCHDSNCCPPLVQLGQHTKPKVLSRDRVQKGGSVLPAPSDASLQYQQPWVGGSAVTSRNP